MTDDIDQLRQSRDEAISELNKALETLGQVRSDLAQLQEASKEFLSAVGETYRQRPKTLRVSHAYHALDALLKD